MSLELASMIVCVDVTVIILTGLGRFVVITHIAPAPARPGGIGTISCLDYTSLSPSVGKFGFLRYEPLYLHSSEVMLLASLNDVFDKFVYLIGRPFRCLGRFNGCVLAYALTDSDHSVRCK